MLFDSSASGSGSSTTSLTYSHTCSGGNRLLIVFMSHDGPGSDTITGVTYDGDAMTRIATKYLSNRSASMWYLINPNEGAGNVVATSSTSMNNVRGTSASYKASAQAGVPDSSNSYTASSGTSKTLNTNTTVDNTWLVMGISHEDGTVSVVGPGTTRRVVVSRTELYDSNGGVSPAGSNGLSVTSISGVQLGIIASIVQAPSGFTSIIL